MARSNKKIPAKNQVFPLMEQATEAIRSLDYEIPSMYYLKENLKHNLRHYQQVALWQLDWVETHTDANMNNQLMFHMATGSGKTDIMAATILYFFKKYKYTDFLFISNSNAIINKTRDNFLNPVSNKYLFSLPIGINGHQVDIKEVSTFPVSEVPNTIYLRLATVQTLANEIRNPHQDGLTLPDLENHKLVILADEAHHLNAKTRSKSKQLTIDTWENTIDQVRKANPQNRQLEFTATIDVDQRDIYEKYKSKIIYKYDLDELMESGYSKAVYRLEANNDNMQKLLNAVLLSEYRKRLAKILDIPSFKPVILAKSNRISTSKSVEKQFLNMMENLSSESLEHFLNENKKIVAQSSRILSETYNYWIKQDLTRAVNELKQDFNQMTTINVNHTTEMMNDIKEYEKLNTLENIDNPFRIIFSVNKLTEGWDVLNLYDIVKISETAGKTYDTNSEAQLIGRGARYYPFTYKGKKSYKRRFDNANPKWQVLETLYYHTINNAIYINKLNESFDDMNLIVHDDSNYSIFPAKVKNSFKKSDFYRNGYFYRNIQKEIDNDSYQTIKDYGIDTDIPAIIDFNQTITENNLRQAYHRPSELDTKIVNVADFSDPRDYRLIKKAIAHNKFYRFNRMKKVLPKINSVKEFFTTSDWLGNYIVRARISKAVEKLSPMQRLKILNIALSNIQIKIDHNFNKRRGTNIFKPIAVKDVVKDYSKIVSSYSNKIIGENIRQKDMKKENWFPYDNAIVDNLESNLIDLVGSWIENLKRKYKKEVYLIRNEEINSNWSLHEFEDVNVKHYEGFKPDFILVLGDGSWMYQVYIEAKGTQLLEQDKWKEKLLESIRPENIKIAENDDVRLYGVKFYTYGDKHHMEKELHALGLVPGNGYNTDLFKPE